MNSGITRPILAIGHSHVACVQLAASEIGFEMSSFNFWLAPGASIAANGTLYLSEELKDTIRKHSGPVLSFVGGASHVVLGGLVHPRRFDFVLAEQPELPVHPDAELLPQEAVRAMMRAHMGGYLNLMKEIVELASEPVCHFEPPPPCRDDQRIMRTMPWSLFPDMKREISTLPFRYKMWRVHGAIIRDWCAAHGVRFIVPPPESVDADGCITDRCTHDGLHGNPTYGALVVDQIRRLA